MLGITVGEQMWVEWSPTLLLQPGIPEQLQTEQLSDLKSCMLQSWWDLKTSVYQSM